jgi:hypothetical protein
LSTVFPDTISVLYWLLPACYYCLWILKRVASSKSFLFSLHSSAFISEDLKI